MSNFVSTFLDLFSMFIHLQLGGTLKFLSLLVLEIHTFFFRKDKFGISLKVIICSFIIRVLWGYKPGPMGQIKGR